MMSITNRLTAYSWCILAFIVGLVVLCPLFALLWLGTSAQYTELAFMNLGWYISNTIILLIGVGLVTLSIGTISAWLISFYTFPGRTILHWALLLPLALPSYVVAYVYTDLLEYAGPVQTFVRFAGGYTSANEYWFPSIRTLGGAIIIMGLALYPYVYLLARSAFANQSPEAIHSARSLGLSPWKTLFRIHLPMARPAIVAGAALAMMEAAGDFGTVDYFAVSTLLRAMYDVWLTLSDVGGAARLALILTITALCMFLLEKYSRRQQRYTQTYAKGVTPTKLGGIYAWMATIACLLPVLLGCFLPMIRLVYYSLGNLSSSLNLQTFIHFANSFIVACLAVAMVLLLGMIVVYAQRWQPSAFMTLIRQIANLGYATPGTVLAVGVIVILTRIDFALNEFASWLGVSGTLAISGSLLALTCALGIRFLAISTGALESGLHSISPSMDMAARSLGYTPLQITRRLHFPLLRTSVICAVLIVFVDTMKELPATLILRPFNFDTLATSLYFYAADERIEQAATSALLLIIPCALAMIAVHWLRQGCWNQ